MEDLKKNIRVLQKLGEFHFEGLSRADSHKAASELARAAMREDHKHGVDSRFGIARDAFGYYFSAQIST